jgi:hypothetical protein
MNNDNLKTWPERVWITHHIAPSIYSTIKEYGVPSYPGVKDRCLYETKQTHCTDVEYVRKDLVDDRVTKIYWRENFHGDHPPIGLRIFARIDSVKGCRFVEDTVNFDGGLTDQEGARIVQWMPAEEFARSFGFPLRSEGGAV